MLDQVQRLQLQLDVALRHHAHENPDVIGRPDLLEQALVERERIADGAVLPALQAGHLELGRADLHLLHEAAQHKVHQILVLVVDENVLWVRAVGRLVRIENCAACGSMLGLVFLFVNMYVLHTQRFLLHKRLEWCIPDGTVQKADQRIEYPGGVLRHFDVCTIRVRDYFQQNARVYPPKNCTEFKLLYGM